MCRYFEEITRSDVLVLTRGQGSLSDIAAYYTDGAVLLHRGDRVHLAFDPILGSHVVCDDDGNFDVARLESILGDQSATPTTPRQFL